MTDVSEEYREIIWEELLKVGRPDSRFHWDFSSFIADFEGSDKCVSRIVNLDSVTSRAAGRVFVTPDNCLFSLRAYLLENYIPFVMTTYGIVRGFYEIDPLKVPASDRRFAATLDGFDMYATPVNIEQLAAGEKFAVAVTGGSAVSRNGVRFGKGHGYFDFEYALLTELGLTTPNTIVIDVVHDCQYVDKDLPAKEHDVVVDWIITPTRSILVENVDRSQTQIFWDRIPGTEFEDLGVTKELAKFLDATKNSGQRSNTHKTTQQGGKA